MENQQKESTTTLLDSLFLTLNKRLKSFDKVLNVSFAPLRTNFDRFKLVWSIPLLHGNDSQPGLLNSSLFSLDDNDKLFYEPKDTAKSVEWRKQGNEAFRVKNFAEAIHKYNLSIRYAHPRLDTPVDEKENKEVDNELALAYANRSAVFFHLNEFSLALSDIEKAMKHGYPTRLRMRLVERKLNCLFNTEQYEKLMKCVGQETTDMNLINYFAAKVAQQKIEEQREKELNNVPDETFDYDPYFKSYASINFEIDAEEKNNKLATPASNSMGIEFSPYGTRGFFVKANRQVKVGELLMLERPFASVLLPEHYETHCFECMLSLDSMRMNVTFCRQCATVSYCSPKCEKAAWSAHHKYECKHLKLLADSGTGLSHMEWLALRIILRAGNENLLGMKGELESYEAKYEHLNRINEPTSDSFFRDLFGQVYQSDSYLSIFNLVTNSAVRKLSDLFRRAFISAFLVKFLYRVNFINEELDEKKNNYQNGLFIGGLILRHLQSISCNAHEINQLKIANVAKQPMAQSFANGIGAGIYALLSLFNHSCDPHVVRTYRGTMCQVRALRPIGKDEEIFDNYGVIYAVNEVSERQEKLRAQYFFECKCQACKDVWPLYDNIPHQLTSTLVKCEQCRKADDKNRKVECSGCMADLDNLNLLQLNAQMGLKGLLRFSAEVDLNNSKIESLIHDIFEHYCKYLQTLDDKHIVRPFRDYNNFEEALKQLLNLINIKPIS